MENIQNGDLILQIFCVQGDLCVQEFGSSWCVFGFSWGYFRGGLFEDFLGPCLDFWCKFPNMSNKYNFIIVMLL